MKKFEKTQQEILNATSQNQLVSAGAGSGKTTVMVQKILDLLLQQNVNINSLLVVTFTVLASEEMKNRLIAGLTEELNKQADKSKLLQMINELKTASIDTIDGFNSKLVKKYFYELQINPNIEIVSDTSKDYFMTMAMRKTMHEAEKQPDKLNVLLDLFAGNRRDIKAVEEIILNVYYNVINLDDYQAFLSQSLDEYSVSIKSEKIVSDHIVNMFENLRRVIIESGTQNNALKEVVSNIDEFDHNLSFKSNLLNLNRFNFPTFSLKELKEDETLRSINVEMSAIIKFRDFLKTNGITEDFNENNAKILEYFEFFVQILTNFINNYNEVKQKNNIVDFNDLIRLALKLLENKRIKQEIQNQYQYIFVDEYQDVNPLQEKLLSELTGKQTKVFMVGDVKQSIYGFRGASPEGFLQKYEKYKTNKKLGQTFDMNVNFRSNPNILEFINQIFTKLMTKSVSDIDYKNDCVIQPKRTDIVDDIVQIKLFQKSDENEHAQDVYSVANDNNLSKKQSSQALFVTDEILRLIKTEFYDANTKQKRKLEFRDIAILSRSIRDDETLKLIETLKQAGVPLNYQNNLQIQSSEAIRLVLSILKCVAGCADDVDYLAAAYSLTDLTMDELLSMRDIGMSFKQNIANVKHEQIDVLNNKLNQLKRASYTSTNVELIHYLLDDMHLRYYILNKPQGEQELSQIEEFISTISGVENGLNLAEFIQVIDENVSGDTQTESVDNSDSVTIQTIHKSKGLEYPVVIIYNANKVFSYIKDNDTISFNKSVGLGVDYYDTENRLKLNSLTRLAVKLANNSKGYKEELRLLYVALTRAKNKLYIVGEYTKSFFKNYEAEKLNKTNYQSMILSCFDGLTEGENKYKYCNIDFVQEFESSNEKSNENYNISWVNQDFQYKNMQKFTIPLKNTVTGLNSQHSEENGYKLKEIISQQSQYSADEDRALIGTQYHTALELLDLQSPYNKNTNFDLVDYSKIEKAHGVLSQLVTNQTEQVHKEADFMMYLPYNSLVKSSVADKVLVQGVVDLIIENESDVVIVDYKFSRLPIKTLKQKYAEQLKLYKQAVEAAFKKPVSATYIYSIETGELA